MTSSGLSPSKFKSKAINFNVSVCAYKVFYLPIEGGMESIPHPFLMVPKKRGPERVNQYYVIITAQRG